VPEYPNAVLYDFFVAEARPAVRLGLFHKRRPAAAFGSHEQRLPGHRVVERDLTRRHALFLEEFGELPIPRVLRVVPFGNTKIVSRARRCGEDCVKGRARSLPQWVSPALAFSIRSDEAHRPNGRFSPLPVVAADVVGNLKVAAPPKVFLRSHRARSVP